MSGYEHAKRGCNYVVVTLGLAVLLSVGVGQASAQTIIYVNDDAAGSNNGTSWANAFTLLQSALDAAGSNHEIWVAAGTYYPTSDYGLGLGDRGQHFRLKNNVGIYGGFAGVETARAQRDWAVNEAILSGDLGVPDDISDNAWHVIYHPGGGLDATAILDGVTVTAGHPDILGSSHGYGGGLSLVSCSPTILNCTIKANIAAGEGVGGGMVLFNSSSVIGNCSFTNNIARSNGGGLYLSNSSAMIANCTFSANRGGGGGGLFISESSPTIANCTITNNTAPDGGGGLCLYKASPTISNCTIAANSGSNGGGLYLNRNSSPTLVNTIVAVNSSGIYAYESDVSSLRHCCVYGNGHYDYSGLTDSTGVDGNISEDPQFAGAPYGDWRIQPDSPCVDTGDNAYVYGAYDVAGNPRILNGTVDIGAYESDGTVWPQGPPKVVRVRPSGDDGNDGSSWGAAKRTVQAAIDAVAASDGGEVWVQAGTYLERIALRDFVHVYGGFTGTETDLSQRDWPAQITVLDGQQEGSVVTGEKLSYLVSRLDGFTIVNGSAESGGGLNLDDASPSIANCIIGVNTATQIGGGVYLANSAPLIADCTITANTAIGWGYGAGMYLYYSSPTITDCTIAANTAANYGGALFLDNAAPTITHCTIAANSARSGGGLYVHISSPTIADCSIANNTASAYWGGGLYLYKSSPTIANCAITRNTSATSNGGGLSLDASSPTIANCTIAANTAGFNGGGMYLVYSSPNMANNIISTNAPGIYAYASDASVLRHNCVYGNTDYNYTGLTDPTGTYGNISVDPQFAGADYGDWRIQPDSPCVDSGDDAYVYGAYDLGGNPRVVNGTVDIGAYESDGVVIPPTPPTTPGFIVYPTDSGTGTYTVYWALAERATSYHLERSTDGGATWSEIYAGPDLSYDQSVGNGSYRYRVRAVNSVGSSAWRTGNHDCHFSPLNDDFTNATPVYGESGQDVGTNAGATKEWGEPDHAGLPGGTSVWWRWTAPATGDVAIDTAGSGIGTVLAVYVGQSVDDLAFVASNTAGGAKSQVFFVASEGRTYAIAVDSVGGSTGDIVLNWALQPWNNLGTIRVPWFVDTAAPG